MYTTKFKVVMSFIYAILLACFIGLPLSFLAFGSDLQTRQTNLYPYRSLIQSQDDFLLGTISSNGSLGTTGWQFANGTSGSFSVQAGTATNPGIVRFETGATSGTVNRMLMLGNTPFLMSNSYAYTVIAQLNTNDANTQVRIGTSVDWLTNPPTSGVYFEKLAADTNWFCVTRSGGVETRTDTGTAVNTSFNTFFLNRNSSGVTFWLNGVLECTHSTNVPTAGGGFGLHINNTAAANKTLDLDYTEWSIQLSR